MLELFSSNKDLKNQYYKVRFECDFKIFGPIYDYAMSPVNFSHMNQTTTWLEEKKRMFENACKLLRNARTLSLEGFLHNSSNRGG